MSWKPIMPCLCICNGFVRLEHTCAQLPQRTHHVPTDGTRKRVKVTRYTWIGSDRWELAGSCSTHMARQQRALGDRQFLLALSGPDSYLHTLLRTRATDPPELALAACLTAVKREIARESELTVALAFNAEPVIIGPCPDELVERYQRAVTVAAAAGAHLAEWIQCAPGQYCGIGLYSGVISNSWDVPGGPLEKAGRGRGPRTEEEWSEVDWDDPRYWDDPPELTGEWEREPF